ncbi:thioredoxin domain-containing protein [Candidatus Uhrbacteria bacterium]|nr:thioredoxin domain-containing protein [Candidatus Uhrbacteria bacterium]
MEHESHEHGQHDHAPHHAKNEQGGITFTLSARTLFFAGLILGLLIMAIPATFFATRASTGSAAPSAAPFVAGAPDGGGAAPAPTAPPGPVKPVSKEDHVRGDANAKITLIEYSDLECPFCQRFHPTAKKALDEYKGKVNWVYRHFPLSFHANAQKEAEASECAAAVGGNDAYWKYIDTIFERTTANGTGFALDKLVPLAKELGIDEGKFRECLDGGKMAERVGKDFSEGQSAGVDGTPGNILLTKSGKSVIVPGAVPYETLKSQIDQLLAQEK